MTTWPRVMGDTNDTIDVTVAGISDATAASWEAHVWQTGGAPVTLTASATSASVVRVSLGSWITSATPGRWNLELQATIGSQLATWPEDAPDLIVVRAQGA